MNQKSFAEKRKLFFLMLPFFFLLVLPIVVAQPPPNTQTNVNIEVGLQIQTEGISVLQQNINHTFAFHVFNISTGIRVDNITTACLFHLFNKTGEHQFNNDNLTFFENHGDFEIVMMGSNFSEPGIVSYYINCYTYDGNIGGFAREVLEVTPTGLTGLLGFYIIIISISLIFLILGFWLKDPWIVLFGTFGLYFVGLYILLNGIEGIRNLAYTRTIAFIILGVAAYISIKTAGETMNG